MESMMLVSVSLASANSILLIVLLILYGRIVVKSRANYAIGLLIFAILLLAQNLLSVFAYVAMEPLFAAGALPFLSGIAALELAGLIVLLRITL
jgi:hypothetical protein